MKATLRFFCFVVPFLFVLMSFHQSSFAQGAATGDLHVSVRDPKENVVTNATVTVRDVAKGLERVGQQRRTRRLQCAPAGSRHLFRNC